MKPKRKVIGIGETVFDIIFKNDRPVSAVPGGSTFNSMISIGRCGLDATFLSETGDDHIGDLVCAYLEENGVSSADVDRGGKSHLSLAFLDEANDANYVFYKDHPHDRAEMRIPEINPEDIVLFGSYYAVNPVIRAKVKSLLEHARNRGAIIYYDINFRPSHKAELPLLMQAIEENCSFADIIRGSNEDFFHVYGLTDHDKVLEIPSLQGKNLIYTCGSKPTILNANGGVSLEQVIMPVETVSTIGAGDNYNAGVIYSLVRDGITRSDLAAGLSQDCWMSVLDTAQSFSRECCMSIDNVVSHSFAEQMKNKNQR